MTKRNERDASRPLILYVEDDPYGWKFKGILERRGYDVRHAHGVDEALELLQTKCFDLLVFDIMMAPQSLGKMGVDKYHAGLQIIRMFLNHVEHGFTFATPPEKPLLVFTGVPSDSALRECEELIGVEHVLRKPDREELLKQVQRMLPISRRKGEKR